MALFKEKTKLNLSSITTSDPSNQSFPSKPLKKSQSSTRCSEKIPKNTPLTNSTSSFIQNTSPVPGIKMPSNLSPIHLKEINNYK